MSIINALISHGDTIVVAVVAIALGWDRFRSGSSALRKEITADYKERNEQLGVQIKALETSLNNTNLNVARLTATLAEKDKHIASLTEILQGRNPETLALLTEISRSNIEIKNFMKMMHDDSKAAQRRQTEILEGQVVREHNIDESSETGEGKPMRTPGKQ